MKLSCIFAYTFIETNMKNKYKYEFSFGDNHLFLSVGEYAEINNGEDIVKVKRVVKAHDQMWHLVYTINGHEYSLENGYRTNAGNYRCEFKRKSLYSTEWFEDKFGNRKFFEHRGYYTVYEIDGNFPTGREGSYRYMKCPNCERILGTQMGAYSRHLKSCN